MVVAPGQVKAASITVLNPSFESPIAPLQPSGEYFSRGVITNWQIDSLETGVFNPSASTVNTGINYFNQAVPDGVQTASINTGSILQQLSAALQPNTVYSLSVFVGRRTDTSFPGYNIELLGGNTVLAANSSVIPTGGTFDEVVVSYTTNSTDPLIGQFLGIRFSSIGVQTNFDVVTLDATPIPGSVPEPSALLGLGLLSFSALLKRKLKRHK